MMLFGLEGSGFVISLAITLLLTGLIMFYVRQRFSEVQENLDKLSQIVPVMTEQMNIHNIQIQEMRAGSVGATLTAAPSGALEAIPESEEKIDVSDDDGSDSDEDDSDEDDSGSEESSDAVDESPHIKNIQLGSELATDANLETVEPDEDTTNDRKIVELDTLGAEDIEEVEFDPPTESDTTPNEKLEFESLTDDDDDDSDDDDDDTSPQEVVIKKIEATIDSKVEAKPDFSKLSVAALREKASQLNDGSVDVSKMKKKELLKLFE